MASRYIMATTKNSVLRLICLELEVFNEAKRLRKQLAPVIRFKTLSAFFAYVLEVFTNAPVVPQMTPACPVLLELCNDIYTKLDKIQALLTMGNKG